MYSTSPHSCLQDARERNLLLDDLPDFLTIEEAARILRIGRGQAYQLARVWRATGGAEGLPNVEIGTKTKRVPKAAIVRLLEPKAS